MESRWAMLGMTWWKNAQTKSQYGRGTTYPSADFSQKLIFSKTSSLNYLTYFAIKNNIYLVNFPRTIAGFRSANCAKQKEPLAMDN